MQNIPSFLWQNSPSRNQFARGMNAIAAIELVCQVAGAALTARRANTIGQPKTWHLPVAAAFGLCSTNLAPGIPYLGTAGVLLTVILDKDT